MDGEKKKTFGTGDRISFFSDTVSLDLDGRFFADDLRELEIVSLLVSSS